MKSLLERLGLKGTLTPIEHNDAMVATVYRLEDGENIYILKVCDRPEDFKREVYFLNYFEKIIPVPTLIQTVSPDLILMNCLPGKLLVTYNGDIAYELGVILARIHNCRTALFELGQDPNTYFTFKFEEALTECEGHFPPLFLEKARVFYKTHLLKKVDGPCIAHRDFRAGNILVENGKVRGIIDWSSARSSFAEEDFVSIIPELGTYERAFLQGYSSVRKVPEYQSLLPFLSFYKAFATIGFLIKRGLVEKHKALYQKNLDLLLPNLT